MGWKVALGVVVALGAIAAWWVLPKAPFGLAEDDSASTSDVASSQVDSPSHPAASEQVDDSSSPKSSNPGLTGGLEGRRLDVLRRLAIQRLQCFQLRGIRAEQPLQRWKCSQCRIERDRVARS